ncbi:glycosyltransferase [Hansschlegelia quercus]|uniref:Glycosyltransferase n=1 Tax=Hansschlegelia quercus TaxID=2528245 RepID=A0A4Q9GQR2_9HYPH|nr:glycosyltransferase [Hansschlegelia quercus]TBN54037.1 glycosyltransferase [Hansschlegelia quercus]
MSHRSEVIVVNDFLHVQGGASRVAIDEAVALAGAGVDVTFFGANGPACAELVDAGIRLIDLDQPELLDAGKSPKVLLQGLWNAGAYKVMAEHLRGRDPRRVVVHLHGYTKSLTPAPAKAAADLGFQVVCTLHDFFSACPNGAFFDYQENRPCGRQALSFACVKAQCDKRGRAHKIYRLVRAQAQIRIGRFPAVVRNYIALSRRSTEILKPYLPSGSRIFPLENIIDIPPSPRVDVAANPTVVAVGRLDREKGVETLLAASEAAGIPIRFVGDGPLRPLVDAAPHAEATGWLSPTQVVAELDKARVLVFPSLWYETFGLVVSEAAARGVPSIVSDVSAASERVEPGRTGWVITAGSVESLAAALRETADGARVAAYGAAAYDAFWANPPNRERHVRELLDIYDDVLGSASARDPRPAHAGVTVVQQESAL